MVLLRLQKICVEVSVGVYVYALCLILRAVCCTDCEAWVAPNVQGPIGLSISFYWECFKQPTISVHVFNISHIIWNYILYLPVPDLSSFSCFECLMIHFLCIGLPFTCAITQPQNPHIYKSSHLMPLFLRACLPYLCNSSQRFSCLCELVILQVFATTAGKNHHPALHWACSHSPSRPQHTCSMLIGLSLSATPQHHARLHAPTTTLLVHTGG